VRQGNDGADDRAIVVITRHAAHEVSTDTSYRQLPGNKIGAVLRKVGGS
jgi:hypothetical protein